MRLGIDVVREYNKNILIHPLGHTKNVHFRYIELFKKAQIDIPVNLNKIVSFKGILLYSYFFIFISLVFINSAQEYKII